MASRDRMGSAVAEARLRRDAGGERIFEGQGGAPDSTGNKQDVGCVPDSIRQLETLITANDNNLAVAAA